MSSLYKRGKIYWISYWDKILHKPRSISTGKKILKEAEQFQKKFEAKILLGIDNTPKLVKPTGYSHNLTGAIELFFLEVPLAKKSKVAYISSLKQFINCCGNHNLQFYTEQHYYEFIHYLKNFVRVYKNSQKKLSINSISNYVRHMHRLFGWFVKRKLISKNIILEKISPVINEVEIIPENHLQQIFDNLKVRGLIKQYNLIKLTYLAALRIGESIRIESKHIDLSNNILYIINEKGKRFDGIPIVNDLKNHLMEMTINNGKLFDYRTTDGVRTFWKTVNKQLNFDYKIHQLRKARGTHLAEKGVNPTFLQKFMRHRDFNTTIKYYIRVDLAKMKEDIDSKL